MFVDTSIKSRFQKASTIIPKDNRVDSEVKVCVDIAKQGLRCPDYEEPEIPRIQQALVSKLYPYFYEDSIASSATFSGGSVTEIIVLAEYSEQIASSSAFSGGVLSQPIKTIEYSETVTSSALFAGGEIPTVGYESGSETVTSQSTFAGAEINGLSYIFEEQVTGIAQFFGGEIT